MNFFEKSIVAYECHAEINNAEESFPSGAKPDLHSSQATTLPYPVNGTQSMAS